jgi:hypothetical protein
MDGRRVDRSDESVKVIAVRVRTPHAGHES